MKTLYEKVYEEGRVRLCEETLTDGSVVYNVYYGMRSWFPASLKKAEEIYKDLIRLLDKA
jgi:hypothetical protein